MMAHPDNKPFSATGDFPYYRRQWNSIVVSLMAAAFIPLILIGGGMYHYAASALKEKTLAALGSDVLHHQCTVDQFLRERIRDLKQVADTFELQPIARQEAIASVLRALNADEPLFTDLGIIDHRGRHLAYAGPFDMLSRHYENADWFRTVTTRKVFVSDLFAGFRKAPHFIIALQQGTGSSALIIRATVNAACFDEQVARITADSGGQSFLVNAGGLYQTTPPLPGKLMGSSGIRDPEPFEGLRVEEQNGRIRVMGWLESVPWLSVVQMERRSIFAMLDKVRNVGIFVLVMGAILIGPTVLLTTNHLMHRLEFKRRTIRMMDHHLRRANRMTLSLQLYKGFFQEMNETLSNIAAAAAWIGEQVQKIEKSHAARREIEENLEQIRGEILRSRKTLHLLIGFSYFPDPMITDLNLNALLKETVALFRCEFHDRRIQTVLDCQTEPQWVQSDAARLRQVLENLICNALTAVGKNGTIGIRTEAEVDRGRIRVTVWDDGSGVPAKIAGRIFEPLFTTHPKRLGLGLSISRGIMEKLGGTLSVDASRAKGAAFVVGIPVRFRPPEPDPGSGAV